MSDPIFKGHASSSFTTEDAISDLIPKETRLGIIIARSIMLYIIFELYCHHSFVLSNVNPSLNLTPHNTFDTSMTNIIYKTLTLNARL